MQYQYIVCTIAKSLITAAFWTIMSAAFWLVVIAAAACRLICRAAAVAAIVWISVCTAAAVCAATSVIAAVAAAAAALVWILIFRFVNHWLCFHADIVTAAVADVLFEHITHCDGRCCIWADALYPYVFVFPQFIHHAALDVRHISAAALTNLAVDAAVEVYHHAAAVHRWQYIGKAVDLFAVFGGVVVVDNLTYQLHRDCHIAWRAVAVCRFCAHDNLTFDCHLNTRVWCVAVDQLFFGVCDAQ